jgi:hypothetical protein
LPGWDSLEAVSKWVTFYEILMILCLAALVGAEVFHFKYSHRKDALIELRDRAAEIQRQTAEVQRKKDGDEAEARRKTEVERLQTQLSEADKKVTELQIQQEPRKLTPEQKRALIAVLTPFRGEKIDIVISIGDNESKLFAAEFVSLFREAGWDAGQNDGINQAVYTGVVTPGIQVTLNQTEAQSGRLPRGAEELTRALMALGLAEGAFTNPQTSAGKIEFRVGPKKPK